MNELIRHCLINIGDYTIHLPLRKNTTGTAKSVRGKMVPRKNGPRKMVPGKMVSGKLVPGKMVPGKMIPGKMVPGKLVPHRASGNFSIPKTYIYYSCKIVFTSL